MKQTILIIGSIFLLVGISLNPTIAVFNSDDITPPVTTHYLNPPEPDGENGWYISDVTVKLNATDDMSGVKEIKYKVWGGPTQTIIGDNGSFIIDDEDEDISVEYWAIDNAGNEETHHTFYIPIDQTDPIINFRYEVKVNDDLLVFIATASDETSNMNRVEFVEGNIVKEIVYGPGPEYIRKIDANIDFYVRGLIYNRIITDDHVKFYAIRVSTDFYIDYYPGHFIVFVVYAYDNAGNSAFDEIIGYPPSTPPIESFKWFTFPSNYSGSIGKHLINAFFEDLPISVTQFTNVLNFEINPLFLRFLDHFPFLHRLLDILRNVLV